jgi:hypothetical protein
MAHPQSNTTERGNAKVGIQLNAPVWRTAARAGGPIPESTRCMELRMSIGTALNLEQDRAARRTPMPLGCRNWRINLQLWLALSEVMARGENREDVPPRRREKWEFLQEVRPATMMV